MKPLQEVFIEDPVVEIIGSNLSIRYDWRIEAGPLPRNRSNSFPCIPFEVDDTWNRLKCRIDFPDDYLPSLGEEFGIAWSVGPLRGESARLKFVHKPTDHTKLVVACALVSAVLVICAIIGLYLWIQKRKKEKPTHLPSIRFTNTDHHRGPSSNDYIGLSDRSSDVPLIVPRAPAAIDPAVIAALTDCNKLLAKEWLTLGDIVGKGHFGCVYRARLYKPDIDDETDVAVKTIQNPGAPPVISCLLLSLFPFSGRIGRVCVCLCLSRSRERGPSIGETSALVCRSSLLLSCSVCRFTCQKD